MLSIRDKKGNILTENIIFIVLNLVFITILILFLFTKVGSAAVLEEKYAKEIAMLINAAEPVMTIDLKMDKAIEKAKGEKFPIGEIVKINGNIVTVRLKEESQGYSYSFFNDVNAIANLETQNKTSYYFVITEKQ